MYYFLKLIFNFLGPKSFQDLRTVENEDGEKIVCSTYQAACVYLGLTENDKESEEVLQQAFGCIISDKALKETFVNLMINGMATNPWDLFLKFQTEFCSNEMKKANVSKPTPEMINKLLLEMKEIFEEQDEDMAFYFGEANMPTDVPKEKPVPQEYQCEVDYDLAVEIEKAETNKGNIFCFYLSKMMQKNSNLTLT